MSLLPYGFCSLHSLRLLDALNMGGPGGLRGTAPLGCLLLLVAVLATLLIRARAECNSAFFTFPAARCE